MNLRQAVDNIDLAMEKMRLHSGEAVFDERMILSVVGTNIDIVHYFGPRSKPMEDFELDMRMLEDEMISGNYETGHFYFSQDATGRLYDAFMVAGPNKYVIFNNIKLSMTEIAADPFWTTCQVPFVELSEKFQMDPLT